MGKPLGGHGVCCLSGLRNNDGQLFGSDWGIPIFEFAGIVNVCEDVREILKHILSGQARVTTGAGGNDVDPPKSAQFLGANAHLGVDSYVSVLQRNARRNCVLKRLRLLEDLLEHEMRKSVFVGQVVPPSYIAA